MVKDSFKYPLKTLDQMPRDPADCRPIFSLASAGATWPIKFWKSQRLEISEPFCYPPWFPPGFKHYHWDFTFPYNQHELLLLLLNVASCPFSVPLWEKLGFIFPSSIHWGFEKHNSVPLCLVSLFQVDQEQSSPAPLPGCHTLKGSTQHLPPSCSLHQPWQVHSADQVGGKITAQLHY